MTASPSRHPAAVLGTGPRPDRTAFAVSPHHLASQAGIDIMAAGGNAVDAGIAINAVLGVVAPDTCGPGGDLFALVHVPGSSTPLALNSSGRAGSGVTADDLRDRGLGEIPMFSPWSISVPGCVDGWHALSEELGNLTVGECLAPAIDVARNGFEVGPELASSLHRLHSDLLTQESADSLYPNREPPAPYSTITRVRHAETLEAIASDGRDAFYSGDVGEAITAATEGAVTTDDLAVDQAEWIAPAELNVFGRTGWTIPPNSQGYLTLATLWIFESLDPPHDPSDPLYHHLLIEAYRSVAWERQQYVTDPATAPLTPEELLDVDRLSRIAATISKDRAGRWPMPKQALGGTAYMTASDPDGMAVSYIQSNYFGIGSRRSAGGHGIFLHNRGAGFNLIQGHPNEYTPGNRPMHTLAPTIWTRNNELDLVLGTRGGDQQPQYLAQFAAHHYHAALPIDQSQAAPRWAIAQPEPGTDSLVTIEPRFSEATIVGLRDRGHAIDRNIPWNSGYGPISAIDVGGRNEAAADPRVSTSTALFMDAVG
jgi:gamma-glutamyltranspeptidase / glutathione hydrolase